MKAALIGPGAIGTIIAADLARNGLEIHLVCKHDETVRVVQNRGMRVIGVDGEYVVRDNIHPVRQVSNLPRDLDLALIATKCQDVAKIVHEIKECLSDKAIIVTMQNGIVEEEVRETVPPERVTGCVVSFGATLLEPACAQKTSHGELVLGRLEGERTDVDDRLMEMLAHTEPTVYTENIFGYKYSKLLINSAISSLGAVSGMALGDMLERKGTRIMFLSVISEGVRIAHKAGIRLEVLNRLRAEDLLLSKKHFQGFHPMARAAMAKKHMILKVIGSKYRDLRSSSLQSIERGKPSEIDYLNGYLVRKGDSVGMQAPINAMVTDMVRRIERGDAKPSPDLLTELEERTLAFWGG